MTLETSLEFGTSDEITSPFRYCTTCKRFLERVRFNFTRKTCCKCLSKSRDRANLRRRKLQFNTTLLHQRVSETLSKLKASGRRICSSCKVAKKLSSFATTRKTCKTCLEKKRRGNCQHAGQCRHLKNTASWCWNCFTYARLPRWMRCVQLCATLLIDLLLSYPRWISLNLPLFVGAFKSVVQRNWIKLYFILII